MTTFWRDVVWSTVEACQKMLEPARPRQWLPFLGLPSIRFFRFCGICFFWVSFLLIQASGLSAEPLCYAIADSDKITSSDELIVVDTMTGTSTAIGSLATLDAEAAALSLDGQILYAANGGQLGTVDLLTGLYTALPSPFGSAAGAAGIVALDDVDGLTFDPLTGLFYGVHRTAGADTPDLLFRIDTATGTHVAAAFGPGVDYVELQVLLGLESIDDVAIDPLDGQMFGVANDDPSGFSDRLVRIDKVTGAITDVGALGVADMEGLSFTNGGILYGSTGEDSPVAGEADSLYEIDTKTGLATAVAPLLSLFTDYEALACLSQGINALTGTVFLDSDIDGLFDPPIEPGEPGVLVRLYRDLDSDGQVGSGDLLIQTIATDGDGFYSFQVAAEGGFVVDIDVATLPSGTFLTTDNIEEAFFVGFGNLDPNNDFGFILLYILGDRVWYDTDRDGIQDPSEPGVEGIDAKLFSNGTCAATVSASDTTKRDGIYGFEQLLTGVYCVQFSGQPSGWQISPQNQGGDEALDSDADPGTGQIFNIVLQNDDLDEDLGLYVPGTIGDTVWCDGVAGNQTFDPGEGIAGVEVTLFDDDDCNGTADGAVLAVQETVGDGQYLFTDLVVGPPGGPPMCYVVEVDSAADELGNCDIPITPLVFWVPLDASDPHDLDNDFGFELRLDFGDAPEEMGYPTLRASDGARHGVLATGNPTLGASVDSELDGLPDASHMGDDLGKGDDENGVILEEIYIPGTEGRIQIAVGEAGGLLSLWIDFEHDGDFTGPGEQIAADLPVGANSETSLAFLVPPTPFVGTTCVRARLSSQAGLSPMGPAPDGEVEDHNVAIGGEEPSIGLSKELVDVIELGNGVFQVIFEMGVSNLGNVPLDNIQIITDLAAAFDEADAWQVSLVFSDDLSVNPSFDGGVDTNLLTGADVLDIGEVGYLLLAVDVTPGDNEGPYECSSVAIGVSPGDMEVDDPSQDGDDPDPDDDGDPTDDNDPTIIIFGPRQEIPTLGEWGLILLSALLATAGLGVLRRRADGGRGN